MSEGQILGHDDPGDLKEPSEKEEWPIGEELAEEVKEVEADREADEKRAEHLREAIDKATSPEALEARKERVYTQIVELLRHNGLIIRAVIMPLEPIGNRPDQAMLTARWTLDQQ